MGWLVGWSSRKALVDHLLKTTDNERYHQAPIAKFFSGNHLWTVWERTLKSSALHHLAEQATENPRQILGKKERFIVVFLLQCWPIEGGTQGEREWGYKDVEECMGPNEVTCPLKFLEMVPESPLPHGPTWRERVKAHWKFRAERLKQRRARRGKLPANWGVCV